jgi:hypothetical protein
MEVFRETVDTGWQLPCVEGVEAAAYSYAQKRIASVNTE